MNRIMQGVLKFKHRVFPKHQETFVKLKSGQQPDALFITCADSRVSPTLLTQSIPGELFICRNAGNIVPPYGEVIGGVSATIEYAVLALKVRDIILCGHSDCGAMKAVLHPEHVAEMPSVAAWLRFADSVRSTLKENYSGVQGDELLRAAIEENVLVQLDHLRTHPSVAARVRKGAVRLHGWYYDIGTGDVAVYDASQNRFVPVKESVRAASVPEDSEAVEILTS
jgi:carbonic anhydrase